MIRVGWVPRLGNNLRRGCVFYNHFGVRSESLILYNQDEGFFFELRDKSCKYPMLGHTCGGQGDYSEQDLAREEGSGPGVGEGRVKEQL